MWKFKKQYKESIIFVRGFGNIDTRKVNANDIYKHSLIGGFGMLAKFIQKDEAVTKKPISKKAIK
tara:strand:+ start:45 stop:239 length:195 start_codon:yes stop_codon:yes gene_type:complete